jgi:hypothetical protein
MLSLPPSVRIWLKRPVGRSANRVGSVALPNRGAFETCKLLMCLMLLVASSVSGVTAPLSVPDELVPRHNSVIARKMLV